MAYDFPSSPTNGQIVTGPGGIQWQWDNVKWTVINSASPGVAPINNPIFTGDPQAPTPALTDSDQSLATTAFTQGLVAPLSHNVGRNLLHNGLFNIGQRGAGPFTTAYTYTLDRWQMAFSGDTLSVSQQAINDTVRGQIGDEAAGVMLQAGVVGNAAATSYSFIFQPIENVRRLANKTVTVSFYAVASAAGLKVGVSLDQQFGSGGSPSPGVNGNGQSVTLAASWARYSLTFAVPSIAGMTLGTNLNNATQLNFWLSSGSNFTTRTGGIGVQSGTVQFWGMQLEIGPTATPLEKLDPRLDLANCQRFYQTYANPLASGYAPGGQAVYTWFPLPVTMRASPSVVFGTVTYSNASNFTATYTTNIEMRLAVTITATGWGYGNATMQLSADL